MHCRTCTRCCTHALLGLGVSRKGLNGSEPFALFWSSVGGKSYPDQCQDTRDTERRVSTGVNSRDFGSLFFGEPATLEVANSIGRHCALLDEYECVAVTQYC